MRCQTNCNRGIVEISYGENSSVGCQKSSYKGAGSLQVYAGQIDGIESTIQNMVIKFETDDSAVILQIDASNAFKSLN